MPFFLYQFRQPIYLLPRYPHVESNRLRTDRTDGDTGISFRLFRYLLRLYKRRNKSLLTPVTLASTYRVLRVVAFRESL